MCSNQFDARFGAIIMAKNVPLPSAILAFSVELIGRVKNGNRNPHELSVSATIIS
jgi:uncharacterized sodium:solute symporter family permease YidK